MTWYLRPMLASLRELRNEADRHVVERHRDRALGRTDEPRDGSGDLDVGAPRQQLLEHHAHLTSREVRAEAEVHAAAPERDVRVGAAVDVEPVGFRERARITVRG